MELKQVKELIAIMERAGLKRLRIREEKGFELELERPSSPEPSPVLPSHSTLAARELPRELEVRPAQETERSRDEGGRCVLSPMVGTLYLAVSPEDPPFVKVGDRVDENSVVCIIEAMKVMNEVKAGTSGTIVEILVDNAHPVEFGTKLMRIT